MSPSYYVAKNGQTEGPYTLAQMRGMWKQGTLTAVMQYVTEGETEWKPLSQMVKQLEPAPMTLEKRPGRLTWLGLIGTFLFISGALLSFQISIFLFLANLLLGLACFLWLRSEKAKPLPGGGLTAGLALFAVVCIGLAVADWWRVKSSNEARMAVHAESLEIQRRNDKEWKEFEARYKTD